MRNCWSPGQSMNYRYSLEGKQMPKYPSPLGELNNYAGSSKYVEMWGVTICLLPDDWLQHIQIVNSTFGIT